MKEAWRKNGALLVWSGNKAVFKNFHILVVNLKGVNNEWIPQPSVIVIVGDFFQMFLTDWESTISLKMQISQCLSSRYSLKILRFIKNQNTQCVRIRTETIWIVMGFFLFLLYSWLLLCCKGFVLSGEMLSSMQVSRQTNYWFKERKKKKSQNLKCSTQWGTLLLLNLQSGAGGRVKKGSGQRLGR